MLERRNRFGDEHSRQRRGGGSGSILHAAGLSPLCLVVARFSQHASEAPDLSTSVVGSPADSAQLLFVTAAFASCKRSCMWAGQGQRCSEACMPEGLLPD